MSLFLKDIIDNYGIADEIVVPAVKKSILEKVIEYCNYAANNAKPVIEKPLRTSNLAELIPLWYSQYIDLESETLFEIILAANFLNIPCLLELGSAKVASSIRSRSIPEIRQYLNIENDFTPEEE